MDEKKPNREELRAKLRNRVIGARVKRMTKSQRMEALRAECSKAGLDPEQMISNAKKNQKKKKVVVKK